MTKHRFTKPGKGAAYETALAVVAKLADDDLISSGWRVWSQIQDQVSQAHPALAIGDISDVSAKALRVERGRRKGQNNGGKTQKNVRLNQSDQNKLADLAREFDNESQAVRYAIRDLHRKTFG